MYGGQQVVQRRQLLADHVAAEHEDRNQHDWHEQRATHSRLAMDEIDCRRPTDQQDQPGGQARDGGDEDRQLLWLGAERESEQALHLEYDDDDVEQRHPCHEQEGAALEQAG